MRIERFTKEKIEDVLEFEKNLRKEESFYTWPIDETYIDAVTQSFEDKIFNNTSISFLAYEDNQVVGRIDCSLIHSHFDGSTKAYLDWICVLKSYRHSGIAQALMSSLRQELKQIQVTTLVGLIASNEEAQRFYRHLDEAMIRDEGIWIDIK